jgi:hypothetical protein
MGLLGTRRLGKIPYFATAVDPIALGLVVSMLEIRRKVNDL